MVDTILAAQGPRAASKQLQLINDVPAALPLVWADVALLERVIKNLVDNSIKFTPVGGTIRITADQDCIDMDETCLLVTVADTGSGIPAELQPRLFEQFVTGPQAETGSGLGLAFCKIALAAHGQRIWVTSEPGQGAAFTFSLRVSLISFG